MNNSRPQLFGMLAGLFLAVGLVLSSMLATTTWLKVKNSQFITVKGSTRKNVKSDLVIWKGSSGRGGRRCWKRSTRSRPTPRKWKIFWRRNGVTNCRFQAHRIEELKAIEKIRRRLDGATHGRLSPDADRSVESAGRGPAGHSWTRRRWWSRACCSPPSRRNLFTPRSAEEKIEMLADATKDARARAEQIAAQGGRNIAQSARRGTWACSRSRRCTASTTSWQGENDTSSLDKTITAVVTATFLLK